MNYRRRTLSDLPVWYEMGLFVGPFAHQLRESCGIQNVVDGSVGPLPDIGEGGCRLPPAPRLLLLPAFDKPQHFAHAQLVRPSRQQIAALRPPPRFHKTALLETRQNEF